MNLTEITYTKIKYVIRKFPGLRQLFFFYRRKQHEYHNAEIVENPG